MSSVSVRYIVSDVEEAVRFYRDLLGFSVDLHPGPGFASLSRGELRLLLSKPGGGGGAGRSMPGGEQPEPGGWNRFQFVVDDIEATVAGLKGAGSRFRNDIVNGNGGRQCLVEDPSGNPVEIFQPV